MKIEVPEEEASKLLDNVKEGGDMGILFAGLEPWDWKGANEELRKERERADAAEANAKKANQQLLSIQNNLIKLWKSEERTQEDAVRDLIDLFNMEEKDALDLWDDMNEHN